MFEVICMKIIEMKLEMLYSLVFWWLLEVKFINKIETFNFFDELLVFKVKKIYLGHIESVFVIIFSSKCFLLCVHPMTSRNMVYIFSHVNLILIHLHILVKLEFQDCADLTVQQVEKKIAERWKRKRLYNYDRAFIFASSRDLTGFSVVFVCLHNFFHTQRKPG